VRVSDIATSIWRESRTPCRPVRQPESASSGAVAPLATTSPVPFGATRNLPDTWWVHQVVPGGGGGMDSGYLNGCRRGSDIGPVD